MPTVHRRWYLLFLKCFVASYVSLVGLFVLVDAFSNLDEFAKRADSTPEMAVVMGRYYLAQQATYIKYLGGIVVVLAVFYTLVETQRQIKDYGARRP